MDAYLVAPPHCKDNNVMLIQHLEHFPRKPCMWWVGSIRPFRKTVQYYALECSVAFTRKTSRQIRCDIFFVVHFAVYGLCIHIYNPLPLLSTASLRDKKRMCAALVRHRSIDQAYVLTCLHVLGDLQMQITKLPYCCSPFAHCKSVHLY